MSDSTDLEPAPAQPRLTAATAFAAQPASFWVVALASIGMIIGGVGPWATAFGFESFAGTQMHGWRAVSVGVLALAMLGLHQVRGARLPLIVAGVGGALGALLAIATLAKIHSGGAVTVLGQQYRYINPAWGLYLVLAGAIALVCSTSALARQTSRAAA